MQSRRRMAATWELETRNLPRLRICGETSGEVECEMARMGVVLTSGHLSSCERR